MIKIIDDGKGESQSFEAVLNFYDDREMWHYSVDLRTYGASEAEARESLRQAANHLIEKLNLVINHDNQNAH